MPRKPKEPPPPAPFVRSASGTPARVRRTNHVREGRWLYRLDYGDVVGNQEWTLPELEATGVRWLKIRPRDWGGAS